MKKIAYFFAFLLLTNFSFAAGGSGNDGNELSLYKGAKKFIVKAKKLEKKDPNILNYLGFTLRKAGNFKEAEMYYLKGLELDSGHLGINEYLGELYVQTDRIDLAKKRLEVLNGCKCEEYEELKELIEKN